MASLKKADFYYGAILSHLVNEKAFPALIEEGAGRRMYAFTTNQGNFRLYAKYRANPTDTKRSDYSSWQFTFMQNETIELRRYLDDKAPLSMALVCGTEALDGCEIAFLHKAEIAEILNAGKNSLTISRRKGERNFRVSVGGGRENAMLIECNRPY